MFSSLVLFDIVGCVSAAIPLQLNAAGRDYKLELVQAIFRHGDRTPDERETYPKDEYKEYQYEPYGHGQITTRGKLRAYELGQILRKQYGAFLGEYKSGDIYAYHTDFDRTKITLKAVLSSLYFPCSTLTGSEEHDWFPIPIDSNPKELEPFFQMFKCPQYQKLLVQAKESPEVKEKLDESKKFFDHLEVKSGMNINVDTATLLYSCIRTQTDFGFPFPDWCTNEIFEKLKDSKALWFDLFTYTDAMNKIAGGPIVETFITNIKESESKGNKRKIHLYSAHDVNVLALLRAHGITNPKLIDFGCTVILEKLRGKDDTMYIRLLLWPGHGEQLTVLKLKNCNEICPWEEYLKVVDSVRPSGGECDDENLQSTLHSVAEQKS